MATDLTRTMNGGTFDFEAALAEAERQNAFLTLDEGFEVEDEPTSDDDYAELVLGWADEDRRMGY